MVGHIAHDHACPDLARIKGADLRIHRANLRALIIIQRRKVDRTRDMIERKLCRGPNVDDRVEPVVQNRCKALKCNWHAGRSTPVQPQAKEANTHCEPMPPRLAWLYEL